jgi:putative tryptophan/tyrosine transport system substrate-binding protein
MKRRSAVQFAGAMLVAPRLALGQPVGRKFRVLVLHSAPIPSGPYHAALKEGLAASGFLEGKNLVLDTPVISSTRLNVRQDSAKAFAQKPDAVVAFTSNLTDDAIIQAPTVPLVFVWVADPVRAGLAKNYARPGGNATGVSNRFAEVAVKRLELLRELAPAIRRVAVVGSTFQPELEAAMTGLRAAAPQLGFELVEVSTSVILQLPELQRAIRNGAEALLPLHVYSAFGARASGEELVRLCAAHRIPAIFAESELVEAGALISYGTNLVDDVRRAADILVKVLRGTKPGDIPIDQASQFELAVNLRTARQMKVRIPPAVLARASRVIE